MSTETPSGMVEVTQERFYAALYADRRDIMPTVAESRIQTPWRVMGSRELWGMSLPGWANPGDPARYYVKGGAL